MYMAMSVIKLKVTLTKDTESLQRLKWVAKMYECRFTDKAQANNSDRGYKVTYTYGTKPNFNLTWQNLT